VGHIGGDDFIVMTTPETAPVICQAVISEFDGTVPTFYDHEDRVHGYIMALDRNNSVQKFPLMSISLAVVSTGNQPVKGYAELVEIAAGLKKQAKEANKSAWVANTQQ
jgi:hypothetical protein